MASCALEIREVSDPREWHRLFEDATQKYMTQTWAFGEAKRVTGWSPRRFALVSGNEVLAIFQALQKSIVGIPVTARINLGPLLLCGHADRSADVHRAIRKHWRYFMRGVLLIAPALENNEANQKLLKSAGLRSRGGFRWSSSQLDVTQSEQCLRNSLNAKWRNQLKKAEQSGLQFRFGNSEQDVAWIIQRHSEHQRDAQFDGPSAEFILSLYRASPDDFHVYRACSGGEDLAGIAVYRFGDHAHYYIGWNGTEGRKLNAGNFLLWNAALDLKGRGCHRFDLGGHSIVLRGGFNGFKRGMQGTPYETAGEYFCF